MRDRLIDVACTKCKLYRDAITVKVSSRGAERPLILFVAEAPGKTEDLHGTVLIGKAGKKLDSILEEVGIQQEWCRFTNTVRCIPHGDAGGVRPPDLDEISSCRAYLEAEILVTNPVFIVPLGMTAIRWFTPTARSVSGFHGTRFYVDIPSVRWRYEKYRKWLELKGRADSVPLVYSDEHMRAALVDASKIGFPTIPVRSFTVFPTYHPAAILRGNMEAEQHMTQDLRYLRQQITGDSAVPWDKYQFLMTLEDIRKAYEDLKQLYLAGQIKYLVSDVEVTTLDIYLCEYFDLLCFCLSWGSGKAILIPFNHPESPFYRDKLALGAIVSMTNDLFSLIPLVGHNFKFDTHCFWKVGINPQTVYDDTYLASWTLFNDTCDHNLELLASRNTGMLSHKEQVQLAFDALPKHVLLDPIFHRADGEIPRDCIEDDKGDLYRPKHYGDLNLSMLGLYCCADGDATGRLQVVFEGMLRDQGLWDPHQQIAVRAVLPFARMERDGIKIDTKMFGEAAVDFEKRLESKVQWFRDHGYLKEAYTIVSSQLKKPPKEAKLSSPNIKKAILYDILQFPVLSRTNTQQPSVDKHALQQMLDSCLKYKGKDQDKHGFYSHRIEALSNMMSFNRDNKIYTSYLKPIPKYADKFHIAHTSFGIRTTDTGRFNCRDPSWHIIPWHSIVKKAIVPLCDDGLILISDFSQMELRILAMVTQDPDLLQAFHQGKDLHLFTASKCYQKEEDKVTKAERRNSKAVSFGLVFGRGAAAIAAQLGISIDEAQDIIDLWMNAFPAVAKWIKKQHKLVHKNMEVWTCSGFRRRFQEGLYNSGQLERRAQNTPIQGPASDATGYAAIRAQEILGKGKATTLHSTVWGTIHDALCFSIWPGELYKIAMLAKKVMVDIPTRELDWLQVPLNNDYEVGVTWGELMEMKLLKTYGHVELDGPTEYYDRFFERVVNWGVVPELLRVEVHVEEGDDGSSVEHTKSVWNFS